MSLLEQRQGLPIYKLKTSMVQAVKDNKILIVIGETGSNPAPCLPNHNEGGLPEDHPDHPVPGRGGAVLEGKDWLHSATSCGSHERGQEGR